jgi:hypothetical protein
MLKNDTLKYITWACRIFLIFSFVLALMQNYGSKDGGVTFFGYTFVQFYSHTERRILPLILVSFFLLPALKRMLKIKDEFYISELLLTLLCTIDAFTHVNGHYSSSMVLPYYGQIWFDKQTHFLEGVLLLPILYPILNTYFKKYFNTENASVWAYINTLGLSSIFFVLWEIWELIIDRNFGTRLITSTYDTNEDLMFAYTGFFLSTVLIQMRQHLVEYISSNSNLKGAFTQIIPSYYSKLKNNLIH